MPLCMPVSAGARRQTDHPQTVGTLLAEDGSEQREGDRYAVLNTCDICDVLCPT